MNTKSSESLSAKGTPTGGLSVGIDVECSGASPTERIELPGDTDSRETEPESYGHLDPGARTWMSRSDGERIERILSDLFILHPRLNMILNEIHWLVKEPRRSRARGLIVVGDPGTGKTAISRVIQRCYPANPENTDSPPKHRVLAISVSGAHSTKAMLNRILAATRAPLARRYTISDQEQLVLHVLRQMNCRLLILDEIQDLLKGSESEQLRVIEVIKMLMNEQGVQMLCLGTHQADKAFRADPHIAARFEALKIPEWEEGDAFGAFLAMFERHLPLKYRSDLARPSIQKLLLTKTGGVMDRMLQMLKTAAVNAVVSGAERITFEALEAGIYRPPVDVLLGSK